MAKSSPPILRKGGGTKIATGAKSGHTSSKKLPPFRPGGKEPKTGVPIKKGDKN
jgi:hypothetical protein